LALGLWKGVRLALHRFEVEQVGLGDWQHYPIVIIDLKILLEKGNFT